VKACVLLAIVGAVAAQQGFNTQMFPAALFPQYPMWPSYQGNMMPGMFNPYFAQTQQQTQIKPAAHRVHHSVRPIGDQGDSTLVDAVSPKEELQSQTNAQTESSAGLSVGAQASAMLQNEASMMVGSLAGLGSQAMQSAHVMFTPPYSWMWRVGMTTASLKYDNLDKIADVPELLNLITGYYLGSPEAIKAAEASSKNPYDRFSLNSLSHLFQDSVVTQTKDVQKATSPYASSSPYASAIDANGDVDMSSGGSVSSSSGSGTDESAFFDSDNSDSAPSSSPFSSMFGGSSPAKPVAKYDDYDDAAKASTEDDLNYEDEAPSKSSGSSSMATMLGSLLGGTKSPSRSNGKPLSYGGAVTPNMWDMAKMMNSGKSAGSGGSSATSDMAEKFIKMAGPAMGLNPALVNMAAPIITSFV